MKNSLLTVSFLSVALLFGCSKKTEQAEMSTPAVQSTNDHHDSSTTAGHHDVKDMHGDMDKDMNKMNQMMVEKLGPADKDYEDRFIDMMIPHHEGAIAMAKDALKKTARPELKKLAQDIITAQEKEISMLKDWRKKWYGH